MRNSRALDTSGPRENFMAHPKWVRGVNASARAHESCAHHRMSIDFFGGYSDCPKRNTGKRGEGFEYITSKK